MCSHISTRNSTHKMVPLFYKVEPSHVRYPDGEKSPYAKYFRDHSTKARHGTDTICQWKEALNQASSFSGWSLEDTSGYEGKLVKKVVKETLEKLNKGSLDVAEYPVGLKGHMDKLKDLLKCGGPDDKSVLTVGIWGMGGIGKTTLSKAIYNDIASMFEAACFVSNVRETAKESNKGLTKLQMQILAGLLKFEFEVNSVDEGKVKMREHLGSKRALLILDDVDNREQLKALHVEGCFGGGSRVIITTRDKHMLKLAWADEIYEAEGLEHNQALELFSWHAFLRVCPDKGYEDRSERVVKACKGLPLSLEVMGAHLYDKKDNPIFWDEALSRIESVMEQDLYKTLKISIDGLHEEERQIFLDIACFFLGGERKVTAIEIWEALGLKTPHTAIMNLSMKSLIRVELGMAWVYNHCSMHEQFRMHDHLRDLGRQIVAKESPEDPCKRSRLWHPRDVRQVLRESEESSNLRRIKCCDFENVVPIKSSLALMKNMQFLWLENVQLIGQEKIQFPPKLKCLPLVGQEKIQFPPKLKCLQLVGHKRRRFLDLEFPTPPEVGDCYDVLEFPTLPEGLVLANISRLSKLRRISFNMNELKVLKVSYCKSLMELPGLGSLKYLTELKLWHCKELAELPPLPRGLVQACIVVCSRLKTISFNMPQRNELKVLEVSYCESLTQLSGLGSLKSLTELEVSDCESLTKLPGLCSLESLTKLELGACNKLEELSPLPRGLVQARIGWCSRLKIISFDMSQMNELEVLRVSDCESLTELPGLGSLKSLTKLELSDCESLTELPGLGSLKSLTKLKLYHCENLSELSALTLMESLTDLDLEGCKNVKSLLGMEGLKNLKRLTVELSVAQTNVRQWIQGLSGLQILCLSANRIPERLKLRMQRMLKLEERGLGEYCVLEDAKCTGIVFCLGVYEYDYQRIVKMNISTEDDKILREFPLPAICHIRRVGFANDWHYYRRIVEKEFIRRIDIVDDEDKHHVRIIQEELPSNMIKFRSGDIIRCSTDAEIVGVYLEVLDQNESGNDDFYIQSLDKADRPPKRPRVTSLPSENET
eukprot:Gb_21493 [translate_table: standard]